MKNKINTKPKLTEQEWKILPYLASGKQDKEIAEKFKIKECTIRTHNQHIFRKVGTTNRTELASVYYEHLRSLENSVRDE